MNLSAGLAYAAKRLPDAETRRTTIKIELLSLLFVSGRLSQYIHGQTGAVATDRKPVKALFRKLVPYKDSTNDEAEKNIHSLAVS